jgi:4-diphosphocytidyl-2-C-methyl-D-erythritol kinase
MTEALSAQAYAKVNLFLRVLHKDTDGFHGIETLFCRLDLADTLEVTRTDGAGVILDVVGPDTGPEAANLAVRAANAVLDATGRKFGVRIRLTKRIPVGAGLGGGSADAGTALALVNRLAGNAIPRSELLHHAALLGADVPFCLSGVSLALAWGHGERMLALPALPVAPVLLLSPPVAVNTGQAYGWLDAARGSAVHRGALCLDPPALAGWSDVARMAGNDFESVVFGRLAPVREAFEAMARTRPLLCRMTGSGSTIIGVYRNERDREDARMHLGKKLGVLTSSATR